MKVIKGRKIYLREICEKDLEKVRQWINSKTVSHALNIKKKITFKRQLNWYERYLKDDRKNVFAIVRNDSHEHIGNISLFDITEKSAYLTIFIGESDSLRKGFGSEALALLINHCRRLHIATLFLTVNSDNKEAIQFYVKSGFALNDEVQRNSKEIFKMKINIV